MRFSIESHSLQLIEIFNLFFNLALHTVVFELEPKLLSLRILLIRLLVHPCYVALFVKEKRIHKAYYVIFLIVIFVASFVFGDLVCPFPWILCWKFILISRSIGNVLYIVTLKNYSVFAFSSPFIRSIFSFSNGFIFWFRLYITNLKVYLVSGYLKILNWCGTLYIGRSSK